MTLHLTNPTRHLMITLLAVFSIVATALPTALLLPAEAAVPEAALVGGFEIDGNKPFNGGEGAKYDWDGTDDNAAPEKSTIPDPPVDYSGTKDDFFDPGGSAQEGDRSSWVVGDHTASPPKDDFTQVQFAYELVPGTTPQAWFWVDFTRAAGNGSAHAAFEFNQDPGPSFPPNLEVGDITIAYDYTGTGHSEQVTVTGYRWNGSSWVPAANGHGTINADRTYAEAGIDIIPLIGDLTQDCTVFSSFWTRSRSSGSSTSSQLKDLVGPVSKTIPLCGSVKVTKQDDSGTDLSGFEFTLYESDGDGDFEPGAGDTVADIDDNPCRTGSDGTCTITDVHTGEYWIAETDGPTAGGDYYIPPSNEPYVYGPFDVGVGLVDLADPDGEDHVFVNPRIPFDIDVQPLATNLIGDPHEFLVTLYADLDPTDLDGAIDDLVGGRTVSLEWDGPSGSGITRINDATDPTSPYSCTTRSTNVTDDDETTTIDEFSENEIGTCLVTVNSTSGGKGKLTATFSPDYQDHATSDDVSDFNEKTWVGYGATVGDYGKNLVGDDHEFTIEATRTDGVIDETTLEDEEAADGVTVGFAWSGDGSVKSVNGDTTPDTDTDGLYTCLTDGDGECSVVVTSNDVGSGTITIAYINAGNIDPDPDDEIISFDYDGRTQETEDDGDAEIKDWIDFSAHVSDGATNLVNDDHTFTVTAYEYDGDGDEDTDAPEDGEAAVGVTVAFAWTGDGSVESVNGDTPPDTDTDGLFLCTTNASGQCTVVVGSSSVGSGTITIAYIDVDGFVDGELTVVDYDHDGDGPDTSDDLHGAGDTATKHWIDFAATVGDTATNLVDEPHPFTISVTGTPEDLSQVVVGFVWTGSGSVQSVNGADPVLDDGFYTCSPVEGSCTVTVNSSEAGTGEITIAYLDVSSYVEGPTTRIDYDYDDETASTDDDGSTASKTWVRFVVDITPDGHVNRSGSNHTFTVTVRKEIADGVFVAPDDGTTVDLTWTAPEPVAEGDGIVSGTNKCADPGTVEQFDTLTQESLDYGTCTVTVVDDHGTGTITATAVNGVIEVDADPVTYDFTDHGDADPSALKTWGDYRVTVSEDAENLLDDPEHVFTVTVEERFSTDSELEDDEDNWMRVEDGTFLALVWSGEEDIASETCSEGSGEGTTDGVCTVTVTATTTGSGTLRATYGASLDSGDFTVFDEGTKTWIDYDVTVDPVEAENLVDSQHVFTVTVWEDDGSGGFEKLAGAFPTLSLLSGPGSILQPANLCASDGTDVDGECTVTISSSETGTTTVQASYLGDAADSEAVTFGSNEATKKWVDYLIDVDPDRAVNPVGTTHTFTVTLQRIEDGVATAAADESVALSITGPGDIIEVPAGTIDGDARSGSCTTDAAGHCDVTIASDEVGDTTLTATYDAVVGGSTGTFSDSGLKLWRSDPAIELVKNADIEPTADGLKIINCNEDGCPETEFTFTVTNVGGVHLHDVTVTDDKFGPITLQDYELEVGGSTTGTATYTPTREEIDAGFHENLGTATGVSPDGQTVRDTDPEEVEIIEVLPNVIERPEPPPAPEPAPLPRTGADVAWLTAQGLLALLLGWSMLWLGRRREIEDQA